MKRTRYGVLAILLAAALGIGVFFLKEYLDMGSMPDVTEKSEEVKDSTVENGTQFLESLTGKITDTITDFLSTEPKEVKNLRKKDLVENEEGHLEYYFQQLTEKEKRAYREIVEGVRNLEDEFYISIASENEVDRTYHAVLKDHPELFWIHNRNDVYRTTFGNKDYCLFDPDYNYTETEILEIQNCMEAAYQEVKSRIPEGASTYDIIKAVYIYVIDNTEYVTSEHDQAISGVFWKKNAVCAGYAGAVQYLLERFSVPCIYVDGDVRGRDDGHAWNIVEIDGDFYYLDATNGDQPEFLVGDAVMLAEHKTTIMDYLCPFPKEYEKNYFADQTFIIPECVSTDKNFYVMNQGCFYEYDRQKVYDYCCMRADNNAAVIRMKFADQNSFDQACAEWIDDDATQDVAQYYMRIHGLNEVQYHYGVLEDLLSIYFIF